MPEPFFRVVAAGEQSQSEPTPHLSGQFNLFTGALEPLEMPVSNKGSSIRGGFGTVSFCCEQ